MARPEPLSAAVHRDLRPLRGRQARFVEEFLVDFDATAAAIRAGYAPRTADLQSTRLLWRRSSGCWRAWIARWRRKRRSGGSSCG